MPTTKPSPKGKTSAYRLSHPNQRGQHNNESSRKSDFKTPSLLIEKELWEQGHNFVCGLDEAGRGALAGPLVTAAVILPHEFVDFGIRDSKDLNAKRREKIFFKIQKDAIAWAVGITDVSDIDKFGIQSATYLSFNKAIDSLAVKPNFLIIDFYRLPASKILQRPVKFGDRISYSIAAASILAKVTRDKIMFELGNSTEGKKYDFAKNLGYGTSSHKTKIKKFGLSIHHRRCYCSVDEKTQKSFNF